MKTGKLILVGVIYGTLYFIAKKLGCFDVFFATMVTVILIRISLNK